jgi:S-adenosylmethionine hydrolase
MIITLLTDFGTKDYFVGAMKGAILAVNSEAAIIDITHEIPPQDIWAGAFTLANYYRDFPPKTVHVCIVDPGVGSNRRAVLGVTEAYYFVAPDNGLLSFVFSENKNIRVFELTNEKFFRQLISRTFHGRDIFAPVAAYLAKGVSPVDFGPEIRDFVRIEMPQLKIISNLKTEAEIIHIDHFGNLITNLQKENLPERFFLEVNGNRIERHQKYYAETRAGKIFSILGSAGFLEVVAFQTSAENLLNAKRGDKIHLIGR